MCGVCGGKSSRRWYGCLRHVHGFVGFEDFSFLEVIKILSDWMLVHLAQDFLVRAGGRVRSGRWVRCGLSWSEDDGDQNGLL